MFSKINDVDEIDSRKRRINCVSLPLVVIMRGLKPIHSSENILECFRLSSVVQKHSAYRKACSKINFRKVSTHAYNILSLTRKEILKSLTKISITCKFNYR